MTQLSGPDQNRRLVRGERARRDTPLGLWLLVLCASILAASTGVTAAAAAPGGCGNEGFRAGQAGEGLPDCRAYEQVTPLDKDGIDAAGEAPFVRAASGGGAATFLAGASGTPLQEYTPSLAARRGGAWSADPLLTPEQMRRSSEAIGMTPDLSWVFIQVIDLEPETPGTTLLARSTIDGTVRTVVPSTLGLAPSFVGASLDGSLVVFESPRALPGAGQAISGQPNLYGWDRASGEVRLIGVLNDGSVPAEGAIGGSYDWMLGTTETTLAQGGATRDYYTQDQNVVSATGAAIYFTAAGSGQLYLRRNPTAAQSPLDADGDCTSASLACTVRVSASRKTNGSGPGGADPAGPKPVAFMGASVDGTRSLFTSTEDLTDDASTGRIQALPGIARAGTGEGGSVELEFLSASAIGVAVDGSHLYWANPSRGSIGRAPIDGSGVEEDFVSGLFRPRWVAVDGEYLYWTSPSPSKDAGEGTIGRVRLDGAGAPESDFIAGAGEPRGIAVDGENLYWANGFTHSISRAAIDGGDLEPSFRFIGSAAIPQGVAVNGSHVYWTTNNPHGSIGRSNLDGSGLLPRFIGEAEELRGIAVDGSHVYWLTQSRQAIGRANLDLGEVEPRLIPEVGRGAGVAIDPSHLYWATAGVESPAKDLYRFDAGSGELSDLTPDPGDANGADVLGVLGISGDGSRVYFAANGVLADGSNDRGETAQPGTCGGKPGSPSGSCNLYVSDGGAIDFIARLQIDGDAAESDAANWAATPMGVFSSSSFSFQQTARVSADGRTLLFRSRRQLTGYPHGGTPQLYRYRLGDGGPICVSCNPSGAAPVGPPTLGTIFPPTEFGSRPAAARTRNLSADGDQVFFESVDPLVGADRNGEGGCPLVGFLRQQSPACRDVYEWEAEGAGSCTEATAEGGCLYLLSGAQPGRPAFFADASTDGGEAFFFSAAPLVSQDRDELVNLYDARVNGGLAAQGAPVAGCGGEACRPPASAPPPPEVLGTAVDSARQPARRRLRRCARRARVGGRRCKHRHRHRQRLSAAMRRKAS